jgi:hypothetical protein
VLFDPSICVIIASKPPEWYAFAQPHLLQEAFPHQDTANINVIQTNSQQFRVVRPNLANKFVALSFIPWKQIFPLINNAHFHADDQVTVRPICVFGFGDLHQLLFSRLYQSLPDTAFLKLCWYGDRRELASYLC